MKNTDILGVVEKLNECKRKLAEKNYKDMSFEELIEPGKILLQQVRDAEAAGKLDLPPLVDDSVDIRKMLNTSEKDLNVNDGTLSESYNKKINKEQLKEEKPRTYNQLVQAFANEGHAANWEEWRSWIIAQPEKDKAITLNKSAFLRIYNVVATPSSASINKPSVVSTSAQQQNTSTHQPSENLKFWLDVTHADREYVETAADTVAEKYEAIELLLRRVIIGRSLKRYYILAGDPGIGKTYTVTKLLEEEGKSKDYIDSITYTGSIGKSTTSISTFLWLHRNDDLIILDDCDSFLRKGVNAEVVNILKGCMEPGTRYRVGVSRDMASRIAKSIKAGIAESFKKPNKVKELLEADNFNTRFEKYKLKPTDFESAEDIENTEDTEAVDEIPNDIELNDNEKIPTSWTFNARMIILSNLHESQIDEAIWSRCDHYDLHLTQEEYLVRLSTVIDKMDIGQSSGLCTEEDAKEAKALILSVIQAVIEAGNNGTVFFSKKITLTDQLEFRLVKDLANMWLAMLDKQLEQYPEKSKDQAKKDILERWVRVGVIPRMSAGGKL